MKNIIENYLPTFAISIFLCLLPFSIKTANIGIATLIMSCIVLGIYTKKKPKIYWQLILLSIPLLLSIIGSLHSTDYNRSIKLIESRLPFLLPFLLIFIPFQKIKQNIINYAFTITILILCSIAFYYSAYHMLKYNTPIHCFFYTEFTGFIGIHPTYLSIMIISCILLLTNSIIENNINRVLSSLLILILMICLVFVLAKTAIISFFSCIVVGSLIIALKLKQAKIIYLGIFFSIISISSIAMVPRVQDRFSEIYTSVTSNDLSDVNSTNERIQVIKGSLMALKDHWIFGVGTEKSAEVLRQKYAQIDFEAGYTKGYNSHNEFIQEWLYNGLLGFIALTFYYGILFYRSFKTKDFLLATFTTLFFVNGLTECLLSRQKSIFLMAFFLSILFLKNYQTNDKNYQKNIIND